MADTAILQPIWRQIKVAGDAPSPRANHTSAAINDTTMVVFGGCAYNEESEEEVSLNDSHFLVAGKGWEQRQILGNAPDPRYSHSCVPVGDDSVYIFGGNNETGSFNDVYVLNISSMNWTKPRLSNPPDARGGHSACVLQDTRMYVFGGEHFYEPIGDFHCLDTGGGKWREIKAVGPSARFNHSCTAISESQMIVFGGFDGESALGDTYSFDSLLEEWMLMETTGHCPEPRGNHRAVFYKGLLWIFGGVGNNGLLADLHSLDTLSRPMVWTAYGASELGASPSSREGMSIAVLNDMVYVHGGRDDDGELNDMYTLSNTRNVVKQNKVTIALPPIQPVQAREASPKRKGVDIIETENLLKKGEEIALIAERRAATAMLDAENSMSVTDRLKSVLQSKKDSVGDSRERVVAARVLLKTMELEADHAESRRQFAIGEAAQTKKEVNAVRSEINQMKDESNQHQQTYSAAIIEREELLDRLQTEKRGVTAKFEGDIATLCSDIESLSQQLGLNIGVEQLVTEMSAIRRDIGEVEQNRAELMQETEVFRQKLRQVDRSVHEVSLELERLDEELSSVSDKLEKKTKKKRKVKKEVKVKEEKARKIGLETSALEESVNLSSASSEQRKTMLVESSEQLSCLKDEATSLRMDRVRLEEDLRTLLNSAMLRVRVCQEAVVDARTVADAVDGGTNDVDGLKGVIVGMKETLEQWPDEV